MPLNQTKEGQIRQPGTYDHEGGKTRRLILLCLPCASSLREEEADKGQDAQKCGQGADESQERNSLASCAILMDGYPAPHSWRESPDPLQDSKALKRG